MGRREYKIDWEDLAYDQGFNDDKAMLEEFYTNRKMSQQVVGLVLGICAKKVGDQMKIHQIPVRKAGTKPGELRGPRVPKGK